MTGPGEGKIKIGKADVYIHLKGKSNARVTHVDIELDELNKIIKPGEASYVQGKEGRVFIGLKREMISRAEKLVKKEKEIVQNKNIY
ncbi:hypothetical protein HYW76_05180 [Candidatus Pacearchaeota archaeon]|nr:hypothetical protein [Candidatus Pacearchaeota archaeon]